MSRDMMPSFELYQPDSVQGAVKLSKDVEKSWLLAGGQDSYDWFKDRAKRPEALIDISGIAALKGVRETADGLEVGALTTLTEIAQNDAGAGESTACWPRPLGASRARRSATPPRWAAISARTRAAGTTAREWTVTARVATPATPTRRRARTASIVCLAPRAASR